MICIDLNGGDLSLSSVVSKVAKKIYFHLVSLYFQRFSCNKFYKMPEIQVLGDAGLGCMTLLDQGSLKCYL